MVRGLVPNYPPISDSNYPKYSQNNLNLIMKYVCLCSFAGNVYNEAYALKYNIIPPACSVLMM